MATAKKSASSKKPPKGTKENPRVLKSDEFRVDMQPGWYALHVVQCVEGELKGQTYIDDYGFPSHASALKKAKASRESEIRSHQDELEWNWQQEHMVDGRFTRRHVQVTVTASTSKKEIEAHVAQIEAEIDRLKSGKKTLKEMPDFSNDIPEYPKFAAISYLFEFVPETTTTFPMFPPKKGKK